MTDPGPSPAPTRPFYKRKAFLWPVGIVLALHMPALPHEYQFMLDEADAQKALEATLAFVETQTK